jgi:hypothetical protein
MLSVNTNIIVLIRVDRPRDLGTWTSAEFAVIANVLGWVE